MELNDIIDAILFKCVESRGYYQDIGVLADSVAGRVLSDSEKDDIEREIVDSGLLDQVGAGWGANAKTREICKNGGYVKYITAINKEQKIRHKAQTASGGRNRRRQVGIRVYRDHNGTEAERPTRGIGFRSTSSAPTVALMVTKLRSTEKASSA
jgi:hypothetical protein